jgi:S1-C subfamily serine protease
LSSIDQAVARIVTHCQRPSWFTPWDPGQVEASSGSGFIVDGGLVMTNAHVVADARLLLVFLHGDPNAHQAVVHAVGHDCDLALLRLLEPAALAGREPLPFGPLPRLRSTVETFGYPAGGRQISSTRGVVSRIELQYYSHPENEQHLAVQTDAAINPGNSGGPVVQDGRVVGVAFQAAFGLQGTGYFIPSEVVQHFLIDASGPRYRGFPSLGVRVQNLENPAARRQAGMEDQETGVIVDLVYPQTSADGQLRRGDVLLAVDGMPIANDGSIALPPYPGPLGTGPNGAGHAPPPDDGLADTLRMDLLVLVDRHQIDEVLQLRVLRDGQRLDLDLQLTAWPAVDRYAAKHDRKPRYFVYGGLVFVPLDLETMKTFGKDWRYKADKILLHEFLIRPCAELDLWRKEQVVLLRRLDHPVNAGLSWHQNLPVERVNGRPIRGLLDLVEAFANERGAYHVLEFTGDRLVVVDRLECERANPEILAQYGVNVDRNL